MGKICPLYPKEKNSWLSCAMPGPVYKRKNKKLTWAHTGCDILDLSSDHTMSKSKETCCCLVTKSCPTLWDPMDYSCQAPRPWDFPGKNTGVSCHFILQGIFLTQVLNPLLLLGRWILYHWTTWEAQRDCYMFTKFFPRPQRLHFPGPPYS